MLGNMFNRKSKKEDIVSFYMEHFADIVREPFLILDHDLVVVGANNAFYDHFEVVKENTVGKVVYDLGDGQWDIPELRNLLEDFLPQKKILKDFEVSHNFPKIGERIMLLNARRFDDTKDIVLFIEDITVKKAIDLKLSHYEEDLEKGIAKKTKDLEIRIDELEKLNEVMTGRELKMIKLKNEIADLRSQV